MDPKTVDIDAIRKREQAATPGPWVTGADKEWSDALPPWALIINAQYPLIELDGGPQGVADAEFIAHARTDVKVLLARLAAVEDELAKVRDELAHTRPAADAALALAAGYDDVTAELRPLEDALQEAASKLQAWRTATGLEAGADEWLVWSREYRTWWGPNGCRYTGDITQAGRYSRDAAAECAGRRSWRNDADPPDVIVPAPPGYVLASPRRLTAYLAEHIAAATGAAIARRAEDRKAVAA